MNSATYKQLRSSFGINRLALLLMVPAEELSERFEPNRQSQVSVISTPQETTQFFVGQEVRIDAEMSAGRIQGKAKIVEIGKGGASVELLEPLLEFKIGRIIGISLTELCDDR